LSTEIRLPAKGLGPKREVRLFLFDPDFECHRLHSRFFIVSISSCLDFGLDIIGALLQSLLGGRKLDGRLEFGDGHCLAADLLTARSL